MERLNVRVYVVAALLCLVGVIVFAAPRKKPAGRTEEWMESLAPASVDGQAFAPGPKNPRQSYGMDPETYRLLAPFGIVCRVYEHKGHNFDVVLIASNSRSSFHDPRVCFSGHGWNFDGAQGVEIQTKTRGMIPATLIEGADEAGTVSMAAYFYRGPDGFCPSTVLIKLQILIHLLVNPFASNGEGKFYRFISSEQGVDPDMFKEFVADYMDAAKKSSNDYF